MLEDGVDRWAEHYGLVLNCMARLELGDGEVGAAVLDAQASNSRLDRVRASRAVNGGAGLSYAQIHALQVDNYTVLARAYEVQGNYVELRKVALQIGKIINR